jgi:hypothetical protein
MKLKKVIKLIRTPPMNDERKPFSAFPTSYNHHQNQPSLIREQTKTSI